MGGPSPEAMLDVFNSAYETFIVDNRYSGLDAKMLHAKAMAYAAEKLQSTWPITGE
jgi:hypothetical protein